MSPIQLVTPEPKPEAEPAAASAPAAAAPLKRARVLVVDDDDKNLLAIRTVIEDIAEVEVAQSGEEALRHLLRGEFAVILLDVFMPGMDGYETAQIIRQRDQTKRIPIVFLSAVNKEKEHLMRGYSMGAVDYVFKPVEPVVLRSKVAVFVDLFTMTQEIQRKAAQEQELLDANLKANAARLKVEQELRIAEQRQAAIIQSLPIILYLETDGTDPRLPQFVGGNFAAVTGFEFDAVEANPGLWAERIHPEDRERTLKALGERSRAGAMAIEYRWKCADGSYKHFLDQAVLLGEAEAGPSYAGTLLDVTERKNLEKELLQARKMDAIGQLTGGIAHDFNNLLAAVLGGIGLIERRVKLDDEQKKILGLTRRAAEQGSDLVGRLLAFARRQQLAPAEIDVGKLWASVTDLLAHTLGGLVQLEWNAEEKVGRAYADSAQLELALVNLIINARDAMPDGGTISVAARDSSVGAENPLGLPAGDYVVIAVRDSGTGIPPELIEQVTEPFFTTKDVGKGTGLGLSMVYGFARQSGGALDISSVIGEGTAVEIWLPRAEGEGAAQAPAEPAAAAVPAAAALPLRILLVDDHDGVRETTAGMLADMGHQVDSAADGPAMLSKLEAEPDVYDLIVTDYAMPLVSGSDVLKQARAIRPDIAGIIISGYAESRALGACPDETVILRKPFTPEQMQAAICAALPPACVDEG
ncbi:MAG: response regulator [Alphaproteobacteria bacterium]|nr:MAG: response regulator [Alphaproteobacteria bacterium]